MGNSVITLIKCTISESLGEMKQGQDKVRLMVLRSSGINLWCDQIRFTVPKQWGRAAQQEWGGKHFVRFRFLLKDSEGTGKRSRDQLCIGCCFCDGFKRSRTNQGLGATTWGGRFSNQESSVKDGNNKMLWGITGKKAVAIQKTGWGEGVVVAFYSCLKTGRTMLPVNFAAGFFCSSSQPDQQQDCFFF